jgi:hypothetical protein
MSFHEANQVRGRAVFPAVLGAIVAAGLLLTCTASAVAPGPGWAVASVARPTNFSAGDTQDEVVELVINATEGTYELSPSAHEEHTVPIAWNADPKAVQEALEALLHVGPGGASVTGAPGGPYRVTWTGALSGSSPGAFSRAPEFNQLKNGAEEGTFGGERVQAPQAFDRYALTIANVGSRASEGEVTVTDRLPSGVVPAEAVISTTPEGSGGEPCAVEATDTVTCSFSGAVAPQQELFVTIYVAVASSTLKGVLLNAVTVAGGGASSQATATNVTAVNAGPAPFGIEQFAFEADGIDGSPDSQAGDHPYSVTTRIDLNTLLTDKRESDVVQEPKNVTVELPLGFVGDPLATERCSAVDLAFKEGTTNEHFHTRCPPGSQVGTIRIVGPAGERQEPSAGGFRLYNVIPQPGYPAELGFNANLPQPFFLYASVVPSPSGYRLRVTTPGAFRALGIEEATVTVFGDPAGRFGAGHSSAAFLTNPTACSSEALTANLEVTSWEGSSASAESVAYPDITGCNLLQGPAAFVPSVNVQPDTRATDTPAAYEVDLKVPQLPSVFGALATPYVKDATVSLPDGVAINPSSADGLVACPASGPEGINIEGPEATEIGDGHPGGNASPYDDGLAHAAPGHCPGASTLATVEVSTPLLEQPLKGHTYLAAPACSPCTNVDAQDGKMIRLYMEIVGSGVIVKLPGTVSVDPVTGQLTGSFKEDPQLPFEELKVRFKSGPRAALVNPQACGSYTSTGDLRPWSAPESGPDATPSDSFAIDGGCGAQGFSPSFSAGTSNNQAGAFSPFSVTFSRQDGEQTLGSVSVRTPPGLLGTLKNVAQCPEPQASRGECGPESLIGEATSAAGAGPDPFWVKGGRVYLTGPYDGGPFGLSIVVPAVAGPFNLGDVIVRSSIRVDPHTAQITVASDPLPSILDGIPLQIKTVNVNINRPGFTFNPTNCAPLSVAATISSTQGASAPTSSPFEAANCASLPFKPGFTAATKGRASKANGASLTVKVSEKPGEANIHKVDLQLPLALPARLTTLQKACTEAQFNANPAGCPAASDIGTAVAKTPVLQAPLAGPAYLVSHGGAAFPDVEFVLQANERGGDVEIVLDGGTQIKKGITYSKFETVPDAPISSFETVFPEGPHSVLATNLPASAKYSLCGRSLAIPTAITGQNGAVLTQTTKVAVTDCAKAKALTRAQKLASALKTCRKNKKKAKRVACEKRAHKKYGSQAKKKTKRGAKK